MKEKKYIVYKYISPSGKYYIGQTSRTVKKRAGRNGIGYKECTVFYNAIQKYGFENFTCEIIASRLTNSEANYLETYLIEYYHTKERQFGYNTMKGGTPELDELTLNEKNRKCSESLKGRKLSNEHKEKIGDALRGRKLTREQRIERYGEDVVIKRDSIKHGDHTAWNKGKSTPPEVRKKLSKSHIGNTNRAKAVLCVETGVVYASGIEAANFCQVNSKSINSCCRGERIVSGGYHWKYILNTLS